MKFNCYVKDCKSNDGNGKCSCTEAAEHMSKDLNQRFCPYQKPKER